MSFLSTSGTSAAAANTLVQRDANGRAQFADPSASSDADTKGARDTAIAAIVKYQHYHWSYSAAPMGLGPTTPVYIWPGPSTASGTGSSPRRYPVVAKMKPISVSIYPPTGGSPSNAIMRLELYSNGVATGDFVEFNNNITTQVTLTFPVQGTLNASVAGGSQVDVDLRISVKSGSTVSIAMQQATFTVLFQEVP